MQFKKIHIRLLQLFSLIVMLGLIWTNIASDFTNLDWLSERIEICDPFDAETEKDEKKTETEDDKIPVSDDQIKNLLHRQLAESTSSWRLQSLHHPEIQTPPPEFCC